MYPFEKMEHIFNNLILIEKGTKWKLVLIRLKDENLKILKNKEKIKNQIKKIKTNLEDYFEPLMQFKDLKKLLNESIENEINLLNN